MKKFIILWECVNITEDTDTNFGTINKLFDSKEDALDYLKELEIPAQVNDYEEAFNVYEDNDTSVNVNIFDNSYIVAEIVVETNYDGRIEWMSYVIDEIDID